MRKNKSFLLFPLSFALIAGLILVVSSMAQRKVNVHPGTKARAREHKWAVIIGINQYEHPQIRDLEYAVADAQGVYDLLVQKDHGGFEIQKVNLLTDDSKDKPTRRNILKALTSIEKVANQDDIIFIFFAGHGIEAEGVSYFLPTDADVSILADTGIPMERFTQTLNRTKAKVQVMFFDACHSGIRKDRSMSGQLSQHTFSRIFTEANGRAILSSCAADEVSWPYPEQGHGVFTYYLLEALKGKADTGDGFVTVSETSNYVTEKVKEWAFQTKLQQNPRLMYNVSGEIVLTLAPMSQKRQPYIRQKDGMKMVYIPDGTFMMGDETGDLDGTLERLKIPQHEVYTDAFYMDEHEVTNEQYCQFLNAVQPPGFENNDVLDSAGKVLIWLSKKYCKIEKQGNSYSVKSGYENHPVICVHWHGANEYAKWVGGRLPTEAEWEKAARGGLVGRKYPAGDTISHNDANYKGTVGKDRWEKTSPVKSFSPNSYGLYDMAGNAYEWCSDYYNGEYYQESPKYNPTGPSSGSDYVVRGGSWASVPARVRCSFRSKVVNYSDYYVGFRVIVDY